VIPDNFEIEAINEAIAMPDPAEIHLPDGRILEISSWRPAVERGGPITVTIEAFIDFGEEPLAPEGFAP
jgi:hypothetical protein